MMRRYDKLDVGDAYSREKIDDMMSFKVETTDLANYVTLGTAQTITANKTFNNSCRFASSIDGMSTITGTSFIKSGADDSVVLLGAGGTKPISEFVSAPPDLSNYVTTNTTQSITGDKTFNANVTASGFAKTGKDDTSVLLAGGGDRLLSSFGGIEDLTSSAFSGMNGAVTSYSLIRIGNLYIFSLLACGGNYNMGTFNPDYLVQNDNVITYIPFPNQTVDKGGYVSITHSTGLITCKSTTNTYSQCASATWIK
ncbi:MAG: hypothetical protein EZS28_029776 [Streblomastix strix]|uniref:Uncharacterized protein n=1 Tax=Streblomastix strix TaxID=222440 RepID=A0A5J4UVK0_9EUKA|nr:MAG: hypothetical protein EZS28_029776 [Streblomastix strix]